MANLTEKDVWEDGIYLIEKTDRVIGGIGGISNKQAEQLANRTKYLREHMVSSVNNKTGNVTLTAMDVEAISSLGGNYNVILRLGGVETLPTENLAMNLSALYSAPSPITSNTIASGVVNNWFNTQIIAGIIRGASDVSIGYGIDINGVRCFQVDVAGNAYASGQKLATQEWVLQNTVQDIRLGAESNVTPGVHTAGYVATTYDSTNQQLTALYHRPVHKLINNTWYLVSSL